MGARRYIDVLKILEIKVKSQDRHVRQRCCVCDPLHLYVFEAMKCCIMCSSKLRPSHNVNLGGNVE